MEVRSDASSPGDAERESTAAAPFAMAAAMHRLKLDNMTRGGEWDTGQLVLLWGGVVTLDAATCRPTGLP